MIVIVLLEAAQLVLAWWVSFFMVIIASIALSVTALALFMIWFNTKRGVRANWPVGSVLKVNFGGDTFTVREGAVATTVRYDAVKSLQPWQDMAVLTLKARALPSFYPAELFPERVHRRFERA